MPQTAERPWSFVELLGKVRARDPETSYDAAARQTNSKLEKLKGEIWVILDEVGPLTDDELYMFRQRLVARYGYAKASAQSVRTRRSALVAEGRVRPLVGPTPDVRDDGTRGPAPLIKRPSNLGGPSQVWEAVRP